MNAPVTGQEITNACGDSAASESPASPRAAGTGRGAIPELEPRCGSWVVTSPDGKRVFELFERSNVERAVAAGWKAHTTLQWLVQVNRGARETVREALS